MILDFFPPAQSTNLYCAPDGRLPRHSPSSHLRPGLPGQVGQIVNPVFFRDLHFKSMITPDTLKPVSEDMERAFNLEVYDRAIQNPVADQEAIFKDLLLGSFPRTALNADKYVICCPSSGLATASHNA